MAVLRGAFGIVVSLLASDALSQPLDVSDPTPRPIHVAFEDSVDPGVVGASFGPELAAFYSEQAGIGTISIPVSSHEAARSGGSTAVPGSFTPVVIEVDLGSLEATSQPASGAVELFPGTGFSFTQHALGTTTVAGYVTNSGGFGCASQPTWIWPAPTSESGAARPA